jgi:phosphate transport system permease protein
MQKFRNNTDYPGYVFLLCTILTGLTVLFMIGFIFFEALPIFLKEGPGFLTGMRWDYDEGTYGIFPFIVGTVVVTAVTLVIACPISIFTAIFLAEWAPSWVERLMRPLIELLVGIPSVVYGIFGLYVLGAVFRDHIGPFIDRTLGFIPIFKDVHPQSGEGILLTATVLAIMILPTITALTQESMRAVPREYREGSLALGATKWETIRRIVIPTAASGIVAAIVLGMMRAMGETMAVVMLIGNNPLLPDSIFSYAYPMTSKILNDIGYRVAFDEPRSALFGIAAVLFTIELIFVGILRYSMAKRKNGGIRT